MGGGQLWPFVIFKKKYKIFENKALFFDHGVMGLWGPKRGILGSNLDTQKWIFGTVF